MVSFVWYHVIPPDVQLQWPEFAKSAKPDKSNKSKQDSEASAEHEVVKPRFDFYTILPEMEVVISDEEAAPPPADETRPTAEISADNRYRLQAGSFRKMSDAERQKAKLALLGVEADIQKVKISAGDVYHRVLTDAFDSKTELNRNRKLLQQNGINSLVVKQRR